MDTHRRLFIHLCCVPDESLKRESGSRRGRLSSVFFPIGSDLVAETSQLCLESLMAEAAAAGGSAGKGVRPEASPTVRCWHLEFFLLNSVAREELSRNHHEGEELPVLVPPF